MRLPRGRPARRGQVGRGSWSRTPCWLTIRRIMVRRPHDRKDDERRSRRGTAPDFRDVNGSLTVPVCTPMRTQRERIGARPSSRGDTVKRPSAYYRPAPECRAPARKMGTGEQRDQLLELAAPWERLAEGRSGPARTPPEPLPPLEPARREPE